MDRITSRDNERVKYARRLAGSGAFRQQEGLFFAEGRRLCLDLAATARPHTAFFTEKLLAACPEVEGLCPNSYLISEPVAEKLSETRTTQGLFCLFETPRSAFEDLDAERGILLCERMQDPSNVGAVLRSAAAFGFGGVVLTPGSADPFAPRALRASMGAAARLPVVTELELSYAVAALKGKKAALYAAALAETAVPLAQAAVTQPFALLVGNEGAGLSEEALAAAGTIVSIPMHRGVESLNAAVAASVFMFHFANA